MILCIGAATAFLGTKLLDKGTMTLLDSIFMLLLIFRVGCLYRVSKVGVDGVYPVAVFGIMLLEIIIMVMRLVTGIKSISIYNVGLFVVSIVALLCNLYAFPKKIISSLKIF